MLPIIKMASSGMNQKQNNDISFGIIIKNKLYNMKVNLTDIKIKKYYDFLGNVITYKSSDISLETICMLSPTLHDFEKKLKNKKIQKMIADAYKNKVIEAYLGIFIFYGAHILLDSFINYLVQNNMTDIPFLTEVLGIAMLDGKVELSTILSKYIKLIKTTTGINTYTSLDDVIKIRINKYNSGRVCVINKNDGITLC